MKCRICGANLKKEGDICTNCYKKYQEEEELKSDTNALLEVNRKYSISYEIFKYLGLIILIILASILCFALGEILAGFIGILVLIVLGGFLLFWDKRVAMATKAVFYEKKIVYTFKFFIFNTEKVVKYSDLSDIKYYQTFKQKKYGYGDLCVYAKGAIPGATLLNGFQVKNVENVQEVLEQIGKLLGV